MNKREQILQILERANYYITYEFDAVNEVGTITQHWDKKQYFISYDKKKGQITGSLLSEPIKCPAYFLPAVLKFKLIELCENRKYSYKYIKFYKNGEETQFPYFAFTDSEEEASKAILFAEIYADVVRYGLQPDAAAAASHEELEFILKQIYNINAKIKN